MCDVRGASYDGVVGAHTMQENAQCAGRYGRGNTMQPAAHSPRASGARKHGNEWHQQ